MIVLSVISFNGTPVEGLSASFDELGGTVGRADSNQLVLPDPERSISRVHAQLLFRGGGYALVDRGSNPVLINGVPCPKGQEVPLPEGSEIQLGGYLIRATAGAPAKPADPFAALFGTEPGFRPPTAATVPAPTPQAAPVQAPRPAPVAAQAASPAPIYPPVAAPAPAAPTYPPHAPGVAPLAPGRSAPARGAVARPPSVGGIPDDWDPFAPDSAHGGLLPGDGSAPAAAPGRAAAPAAGELLGVPLGAAPAADSLDALFGLGAAGAARDPFAQSPLFDAPAAPNTSGNADPMRALQQTAAQPTPVVSDHVPDLNTPWHNAPAAAAVPPPDAGTRAPAGAVLSWDQPSREAKVIGRAVRPGAAEAEGRTQIVVGGAGLAPARAAPAPVAAAPAPRPVPPQPAAAGAPGTPNEQALLHAFKQGLGMESLPLGALTPELMQQLGELMRESTRGAVELLVARAAIKREVRAEVTMIAPRANNPLKFSPTVEVALQHLFGPRSHGFMPPVAAMRDAFHDLRAHQLGVMAGMRAALEGVLGRFDPAVLEGKLAGRSALSSLIPATRKAKLWELFQQLYAQLSAEAADDFNELFGKAFLRAYEEHIEQLRGEDGH